MALTRQWCEIWVRTTGVSPHGAQVLLSGETSENPLSSSKTSVAPRARHFFYPRPVIALPMRYCFIVSLRCLSLGLLITPSYAPHQAPNSTRVIPNGEQIPYQAPDPIKRPVIFCISLCKCPALQGRYHARHLLLGQTWAHTGLLANAFYAVARIFAPPLNSACAHANLIANLSARQTLLKQRHSTRNSFINLGVRALRPHADEYGMDDKSLSNLSNLDPPWAKTLAENGPTPHSRAGKR